MHSELFTRQETIELTEATSNQLQYLERSELISPIRITEGRKKPLVFYTWEQILEIRAVRNLKEQSISLQTRKKIIQFLDKSRIDSTLRDKLLIAINDRVFWINRDWSDFGFYMSSSSELSIAQYNLIVVPPLKNIIDEVWHIARQSQVIDLKEFKKRAKVKRTEVA